MYGALLPRYFSHFNFYQEFKIYREVNINRKSGKTTQQLCKHPETNNSFLNWSGVYKLHSSTIHASDRLFPKVSRRFAPRDEHFIIK